MDEVKLIFAIYCTKARRGKGTINDPIRVITEVFDLDGNLIAEKDPNGGYTQAQMIRFAEFYAKNDPLITVAKDALDSFEKLSGLNE